MLILMLGENFSTREVTPSEKHEGRCRRQVPLRQNQMVGATGNIHTALPRLLVTACLPYRPSCSPLRSQRESSCLLFEFQSTSYKDHASTWQTTISLPTDIAVLPPSYLFTSGSLLIHLDVGFICHRSAVVAAAMLVGDIMVFSTWTTRHWHMLLGIEPAAS